MALVLIGSASVGAETVFEGFYRIERAQKHVGFVVQRYRREGTRRILTSYLRLRQPDDTEIFESFKSTADANGRPVASEHRGNTAGLPAIFAKFTGQKGRVDFGAPETREPASVDKFDLLGSFLFLVTKMTDLKPASVYRYHAFAEERGRVATGTLHVAGVIRVAGVPVSHVVDDYLGEPVENFVAADGQPLGSRALGADLVSYWVPTRAEAIDIFKYPNHDVIALFGDLPTGEKSVWSGLPDVRAEEVVRRAPKWAGARVLTPAALAKASDLPRRTL